MARKSAIMDKDIIKKDEWDNESSDISFTFSQFCATIKLKLNREGNYIAHFNLNYGYFRIDCNKTIFARNLNIAKDKAMQFAYDLVSRSIDELIKCKSVIGNTMNAIKVDD